MQMKQEREREREGEREREREKREEEEAWWCGTCAYRVCGAGLARQYTMQTLNRPLTRESAHCIYTNCFT